MAIVHYCRDYRYHIESYYIGRDAPRRHPIVRIIL